MRRGVISIVLPTYERATVLRRAVESVLGQTIGDWELIIVDDGSTDDTSRFLDELHDPRVSVYRHSHNRGVAAAKNTGLDHVRGEWFTIFDSDDEMMPDALEVMTEYAVRTQATVITCNCVDATNGMLTGIGPTHDGWLSFEDGMRCRGEHWGMVKTSLLGGLRFDERLPGWEGILWLKVNRIARRYYVHRALRVYHTEGADRVSVTAREASAAEKVGVFCAVGEDRAYLAALKAVAPSEYRHTMLRVRLARILRHVVFRSQSR